MADRKRRLSLPKRSTPPEVEAFARGADERGSAPPKLTPPQDPLLEVAQQYADAQADLSPKAKPVSGINLRLNAYQHALIRHLSKQNDRSLQWTIKHFLVPALEEAARESLG